MGNKRVTKVRYLSKRSPPKPIIRPQPLGTPPISSSTPRDAPNPSGLALPPPIPESFASPLLPPQTLVRSCQSGGIRLRPPKQEGRPQKQRRLRGGGLRFHPPEEEGRPQKQRRFRGGGARAGGAAAIRRWEGASGRHAQQVRQGCPDGALLPALRGTREARQLAPVLRGGFLLVSRIFWVMVNWPMKTEM